VWSLYYSYEKCFFVCDLLSGDMEMMAVVREFILFCVFLCVPCYVALADGGANAIECDIKKDGHYEVVQDFINLVKQKDKTEIAKRINYPLVRMSPIRDIENSAQFIKYFDYLFDDGFCSRIANSDPCVDWDAVGWRGISFSRGDIWLDYDGAIRAINHVTVKEQNFYNQLISKERNALHKSVQDFDSNYVVILADKFLVRIDVLQNGQYRYSAWNGKKMSEKPDLIINDGTLIYDGNGGNLHFEFNKGDYKYVVYENNIGTSETPPYELIVKRKEKNILHKTAKKVNPFDYI